MISPDRSFFCPNFILFRIPKLIFLTYPSETHQTCLKQHAPKLFFCNLRNRVTCLRQNTTQPQCKELIHLNSMYTMMHGDSIPTKAQLFHVCYIRCKLMWFQVSPSLASISCCVTLVCIPGHHITLPILPRCLWWKTCVKNPINNFSPAREDLQRKCPKS